MSAVSHRSWKLPEELIALSENKTWPNAIQEWHLDHIEMLENDEDSETCLCHHHPIRELCYIKNDVNGNSALLGNCCVTKIENNPGQLANTHKIIDAFLRIKTDIRNSANEELIQYAYKKNIINEANYNFYMDVWRKHALSKKQWAYKTGLNQKIIDALSRIRAQHT